MNPLLKSIIEEFDEYWGEIGEYGSAKYFAREKAKSFLTTSIEREFAEGIKFSEGTKNGSERYLMGVAEGEKKGEARGLLKAFEILRAQIQRLKALLKVARCPDPDCDNNGTIAVRVSDEEWEPQQCQWCHEKRLELT